MTLPKKASVCISVANKIISCRMQQANVQTRQHDAMVHLCLLCHAALTAPCDTRRHGVPDSPYDIHDVLTTFTSHPEAQCSCQEGVSVSGLCITAKIVHHCEDCASVISIRQSYQGVDLRRTLLNPITSQRPIRDTQTLRTGERQEGLEEVGHT